MKPILELPQPLRAAESPSFTNYSVVVRLVDIARRTLAENAFPLDTVKRIQALMSEIPNGKIRPLDTPLAPDNAAWAEYIRPYEGMNWLQAPWFFVEEYFYRRILEATGYYAPGDWEGRDPYTHQKQLGLETTREDIRVLGEQLDYALRLPTGADRESLARLFLVDLWGNQKDLSMFPVRPSVPAVSMQAPSSGKPDGKSNGNNGAPQDKMDAARANVLVDDTPAALTLLETLQSQGNQRPQGLRVDILLDNAGYELVADLVLADFLLERGFASQIVLHAKTYPVFVSDAIARDVNNTIDFLAFSEHQVVQSLAIRLRGCLLHDRLKLRYHPFWTSPLPLWQMPADLADDLAGTRLLISKGDANYRRLLGDLHWSLDLPFDQVVTGYPFGLLSLRTLKSEIAIGISEETVPTTDLEWMIDGRWGLIQYSAPTGK
jgi:hypothetical protein